MPDLDHVTALATRGELQATLVRLAAGSASFAVVICDVVGLKADNERAGFLAGDASLRMAADRLRAAADGAELVARLGGDEMVAVFTGPEAAVAAGRAASLVSGTGVPPMRSAAVSSAPGEPPGPLIERAYATMRRS